MNRKKIKMNVSNAQNKVSTDRNGPWDIPLKSFDKEKRPIIVVVYNIVRDCVESEFEVDYGSYEDRKFIGRVTYWAIKNGRSIETMSIEDWNKSQ